MELWDLYDRDRKKTGLSQIRGEPTIVGRYCFSTGLSVYYRWPGANHKSLLGYRSADRYVGISYLMRTKKRLDVYADEVANIGPYDERSPIYALSLIFVDEATDRSKGLSALKREEKRFGLGRFIHLENLIRGEKPYEGELDENSVVRIFRTTASDGNGWIVGLH